MRYRRGSGPNNGHSELTRRRIEAVGTPRNSAKEQRSKHKTRRRQTAPFAVKNASNKSCIFVADWKEVLAAELLVGGQVRRASWSWVRRQPCRVSALYTNLAMPVREVADIIELRSLVGQEVAVGDWLEISQERINLFADATGDHQWIHVDAERASKESPFGSTVAHGFLTLALIPHLARQALRITRPPRMSINYGCNRVRFPSPVRVNSRLRAHLLLLEVSPADGGWQLRWQATIEIEGEQKPACVAETLSRVYV